METSENKTENRSSGNELTEFFKYLDSIGVIRGVLNPQGIVQAFRVDQQDRLHALIEKKTEEVVMAYSKRC